MDVHVCLRESVGAGASKELLRATPELRKFERSMGEVARLRILQFDEHSFKGTRASPTLRIRSSIWMTARFLSRTITANTRVSVPCPLLRVLPSENYKCKTAFSTMSYEPKIISREELPTNQAKWVTLKVIEWTDQDGRKVNKFGNDVAI